MCNLVVGDIVTDMDPKSAYLGRQAEVKEVREDGSVVVTFPDYMIPRILVPHNQEPTKRDINYTVDEAAMLRRDPHWDQTRLTQHLCRKAFPILGFHAYYVISEPFVPGRPCRVEGCDEGAVKRCLINFVGTVYSFDLCDQHRAEWDGMGVEALPKIKRL